jgi:hypothetical protein
VVRKKRKWNIGLTYQVGWLVTVADGSRLCHPKSDCNDGGGADLAGVRKWEWWETVVEQEVVTKIGV